MIRPSPISEDQIRERAYRLWLEEGQPQGKDAEHWEKARRLLAREGIEEAVPEFPISPDRGEQPIPKKRRPAAGKRRPGLKRPM